MASEKNAKITRVAAYARVSTGEQNLDNQLDEIRNVVADRGWEMTATFTDMISGSKDTRPGRGNLLEQVESGKVDVVVVVRLDRLGRSLRHLLHVVDRTTAAGVDLVSIRDSGIDSTTASGKLMLSIIGAFASFERELLIERTRSGMERARREGRALGRPRVEVPVEAATKLLDQGLSVRSVSKMLGVPRATLARHIDDGAGPKGPRELPLEDAA